MRVTDLIEALEPLALGELNLKPEQFAGYTVSEVDAMFDGYIRRQERLEDLFILYSALPTYRGAYGRKAPSYRTLTKHRVKRGRIGQMDEVEVEYWTETLKEEEAKAIEAQSARAQQANRLAAPKRSGTG